MHRLGSLAYLPHYAPNLNTGISSTTLAPTSSISPPNLTPDGVDTHGPPCTPTATALQWQAPPNFNAPPSSSLGLHLVIMTCDVTQSGLESACEAPRTSVVSNPPAKVATALGSEASEPIGSGMDALNGKLVGVEEEKLAGRVVELWGFFWDQLLPRRRGAAPSPD
ncbi:hypothetical protein BJV77DRAFT_160742 [Russula vinacea]|nr:hypothetical protein BJV77DRAFT_160742 [Russula vinacea]